MRYITKISLCLVFLALLIFNLTASESAGTTGFNFLRVAYSARASAMGGAYTGLVEGSDAVFYNPAGLAQLMNKSFSTTYINYFDGFQGGTVNYSYPASEEMMMAFWLQYLGAAGIEKTTVDPFGNFIDSGSTFGANNIVIGGSFGYFAHEMLNIGANIKVIREMIDDYSAMAAAADIGILHQTTNDNLRVGITLKNLGIQLTHFTEEKHQEKMPSGVTVGFNYSPNDKLNINIDADKPFENKFTIKIGAEYHLHTLFTLRTGYNTRSKDWQMGGDYDFLSGFAFGFGSNWRNYYLDYAINSYGDLGFINQISLRYVW